MFGLLLSRHAANADKLADPHDAVKWLATLRRRDPQDACVEIAAALNEARTTFYDCTPERLDAVLLVDARATPLFGVLFEEYADAGQWNRTRQQKIAITLSGLSQAFGAYYEALIETLGEAQGEAPAERPAREQLYMLMSRRLAHMRLDSVLAALRFEKWIPMRWEKSHKLYRLSLQLSLHEVGAPALTKPELPELEFSAELEYLQVLFTHQLNQGQLDPRDILQATGWLKRWVAQLQIVSRQPATPSFVLIPNSRTGLAAPPAEAEAGMLWVDPAPLQAQIRRELAASSSQATEGVHDPRIGLLNQLAVLWAPATGQSRRREDRTPIRESVHIEVDFARIVEALLRTESRPHAAPLHEIELHGVGEGPRGGADTRWSVCDVSPSGCRLRGTLRLGQSIGPRSLIAIHLAVTGVWMVGIVRRMLRTHGDDVELGLQVLATHLRLLTLHAHPTPPVPRPTGHLAHAAQRTATTAEVRSWALILRPGAGGLARSEQSVIIGASDYAPRRTFTCVAGANTSLLTLGDAIERYPDFVWAAMTTSPLAGR
jgi:hypothetical protein